MRSLKWLQRFEPDDPFVQVALEQDAANGFVDIERKRFRIATGPEMLGAGFILIGRKAAVEGHEHVGVIAVAFAGPPGSELLT